MTVDTHCLPSGSLVSHQLGVCGVPGNGTYQAPTATLRGTAVLCHGLDVVPTGPPVYPFDSGGILPIYFGTWTADLRADGWGVLSPAYPEDGYAGAPVAGLLDDVKTDPAFGARYLATTLLWCDHILDFCETTNPGKPVLLLGMSEGGWHVLTIMGSSRSDSFVGGIAHCPATIWSNASPAFTAPYSFAGVNTTGMDAGTGVLDGCTRPVMVSYGTNDAAVGYDLAGTGGTPVSNTDSIITNAQAAGRPITRNATTDNHELLAADVTTFMSYITGTIDPLT